MTFRHSLFAGTAFVDGEIAAMWGLCADMLSDCGEPWLVTTNAVEAIPVTFVREGRRQVARMLAVKPRLENMVAARYQRAVRFLEVLGFVVDPPRPFGPRQEVFRRFHIGAA